MSRLLFLFVIMTFVVGAPLGHAADDSCDIVGIYEKSLEDLFFEGDGVTLTQKEMDALEIARQWQQGEVIARNPVVGVDGSIEFLFGAEMPSIVCAVMQLTDIELQKGERLTSVNLGDSVRWQIQPAISDGDVTHLLVRPRQVNLDTSMVVTTDRRTYHIRLRSHRSEYMPRVRFSYIEDALRLWDGLQMKAATDYQRNVIPETHEYLGDLNFGYTIKGKAHWKPVRVYDDSVKTIIEMPKSIKRSGAPILAVIHKPDRAFAKSQSILTDYKVIGNRYIVDRIFDKAVMYIGVGRNQERIEIIRTTESR